MIRFIKKAVVPLALCAALLLTSCAKTADSQPEAEKTADTTTTGIGMDTADMFTNRDLDPSYDESSAVKIALNGTTASCEASGVTIENGTVPITAEGVYVLSGSLTDGQIVVAADEAAKVQLVLDGVDITSATSAAIYALSADKVFVTLAEGSQNSLANGGEYLAIDDNNIDAVIFAKTDLTLNGTGGLAINAAAGHGVVSKDDLVIAGGSYAVTAASHGFVGKDSLRIATGDFAVASGKDAFHAENADDEEKGWLYVRFGTFDLQTEGDGISACGAMQLDGGSYTITAGGGSATVTMQSDAMGGGFGGFGGWGQTETTTETEDETASTKGIKAGGALTILAGEFAMDTADDSFHSNSDVWIAAGEFTIKTGDDAVHADAAVTFETGTFTISYCYEGIEGKSITVDGGSFDIVAYDDGFNAAGGADNSGMGGRGNDQFAANGENIITINGGTITVVADGDCLDSNGDIVINGGTLNLTCNGNGNTAIDCNGTYTNNGGDVTTNDGSESGEDGMGGGMMGGGQGGMGGGKGGNRPNENTGEMPSDMGTPSENATTT